jgi:predicted ribosomally synthesized peptide with nif11-like leader
MPWCRKPGAVVADAGDGEFGAQGGRVADREHSRTATPGLEAASAASAPSFATVRIRMIVERSTCWAAAASAIVTSCRTSCNQISYFCDRDRNRFERPPTRSVAFLDRVEDDETFASDLQSVCGDPDSVLAKLHADGFDVTQDEVGEAFAERYGVELTPAQLDAIAAGLDTGEIVGIAVMGAAGVAAAAAAF